jgi:hypothetical protein
MFSRPQGPRSPWPEPGDRFGIGPRVGQLGDAWPYAGGAVALLVAAFGGLDAFGLTLGVLAALQAAVAGRRLETTAGRIEQTTSGTAWLDRMARLGRVRDAVEKYDLALRSGRGYIGVPARPLGRGLERALNLAGVELPECARLLSATFFAAWGAEGEVTRHGLILAS